MMTDSTNPSSQNQDPMDNLYPWHSKCWDNFVNSRKQHHLPHAILLAGEEGIGKTQLAQRMAQSLLCINTQAEPKDACNQCPSCKTYHSSANSDFLSIALLEDKKQISVDQIRTLSEFLNYSRSYNTHRVVIINPVDRMNLNAANSLLKSLEEPTPNTIIILVTENSSALLATIKSRCQLFTVNSPNKQETINWLTHNHLSDNVSAIKDSPKIDPEILFSMIGARPLKANAISAEDIENKALFFKQLQNVLNHSMSVSEMAKHWEKYDVDTLINWQLLTIQNAIKIAVSPDAAIGETNQLQNYVTEQLNTDEQWQLYQQIIQQKQYIHTSVNPLMFMENMIMLWSKAS